MEADQLLTEHLRIVRVSEDKETGVFDIEGLRPGYGQTLANAIRRVLISSLEGAAVTQFKIKGILHEFSTVPHVLEDVIEIGLNFKKVRFHFFGDEPHVMTLKIKGERDVTAGDLKGGPQAIVANPDEHLFTMTDKKAEVDMEVVVEKGRGYVPVEKKKTEKLEVGVVALDALFTPVRAVSIKDEHMRIGDQTDFNRLRLTVKTDGSISPSEAVARAARILQTHYEKIALLDVVKPELAGASEEDGAGAGETKGAKKRAKKSVKSDE